MRKYVFQGQVNLDDESDDWLKSLLIYFRKVLDNTIKVKDYVFWQGGNQVPTKGRMSIFLMEQLTFF